MSCTRGCMTTWCTSTPTSSAGRVPGVTGSRSDATRPDILRLPGGLRGVRTLYRPRGRLRRSHLPLRYMAGGEDGLVVFRREDSNLVEIATIRELASELSAKAED